MTTVFATPTCLSSYEELVASGTTTRTAIATPCAEAKLAPRYAVAAADLAPAVEEGS
jgi:hypothetical protein